MLWRHPLPGRSESSPLVHGGKVIFGCESGDIFALDAKTGKTDWTVHTGGAVKGALAYDKGTVFADNYAGEVWALDAGNGKVKWTAHTQGGGLLPRRRRLLDARGRLGPRLPRRPRRPRVQLRGEDRRARLEPLDRRGGLFVPGGGADAELAAHRLHRLARTSTSTRSTPAPGRCAGSTPSAGSSSAPRASSTRPPTSR